MSHSIDIEAHPQRTRPRRLSFTNTSPTPNGSDLDAYNTSPTGTYFTKESTTRHRTPPSLALSPRTWISRLNLLPPQIKHILLKPIVIMFVALVLLFAIVQSGWVDSFKSVSRAIPILPVEYDDGLYTIPTIYRPYLSTLTFPPSEPHINPPATLSALQKRLNTFLQRPILTHTEALAQNEKGCPTEVSDQLVNPDQLNGDGGFWKEMSREVVAEKRAGIVRYLQDRVGKGERVVGGVDMDGGRGIVLTGGNHDTTERIITLLKILRRQGCTLPAEIFHFPGELTNNGHREEISRLGGEIRQIDELTKDDGLWKNFQIKGIAIAQSSFREVLYLDSDNIPLRDPTSLFTSSHYKTHNSAIFWPDLSKDHTSNAIWRLVGESCTLDHWTYESGQVLIDKAGNGGLNLAALWIAAGMQDDKDFWFRMAGGDKDTFRWGFRMLGLEYGDSLRWMSALGFENAFDNGRFCGHTTLQYDIEIPKGLIRPPPLFVHSNLLKLIGNSALNQHNTFTHIKRLTLDSYSEKTANNAHLWVYQGPARGMCLDLELLPRVNTIEELEEVGQRVEMVEIGSVEGDVFKGFVEMFFEEGGSVGGW